MTVQPGETMKLVATKKQLQILTETFKVPPFKQLRCVVPRRLKGSAPMENRLITVLQRKNSSRIRQLEFGFSLVSLFYILCWPAGLV